ncbi:MAG: Ig-like domain-containing protein [Chloroflexota bacterium]
MILATVAGLALAATGLSVAMARLGPTVDTVSTATTLDGTLVNSPVAVTFAQPMNIPSVERHFHLAPTVAGSYSWSGNEMLFLPSKNLAYHQHYALSIGRLAKDTTGKHLGKTFISTFTTQSQHLLFLGSSGAQRNRLILATVSGQRQVVGPNDGSITEFAVSQDHSLVTFARRGASGERADEIWILSVSDNSAQMVFRRPAWTITQPHLSADNRYIVFLATNVRICRKYYGCYRDTTSPLVYFYDLRTRKVFPFHSTSDTPITNFIAFSPSNQVAYTDLGSALVLASPTGSSITHIPNSGNSLEFQGFDPNGDKAVFVGQTPSSSGGDILLYWHSRYTDVSSGVYDSSTPSFSSSGTQVTYSAYRTERGIEPVYGINRYDTRSHRTTHLTSSKNRTDWAPSWSLDDRYVGFVRSAPQEAMYLGSGYVWVMRSDGTRAHSLGVQGSNVSWVS